MATLNIDVSNTSLLWRLKLCWMVLVHRRVAITNCTYTVKE